MKRVVTCICILAMLLSLCVPAFADFTPSVSNKPAPEIVPTPGEGGKPAIGIIRDENNKIIGYVYEDCIVITPVSKVDESKDIPEDAKQLLKDIYNKLTSGEMTLPYQDVNPNLNPGNMTYVNGKWVPAVSTVNNGDGTVTVVFEDICPIAFSVRTDAAGSEKTADISSMPWVLTGMFALIALVAITVVYNKSGKKYAV